MRAYVTRAGDIGEGGGASDVHGQGHPAGALPHLGSRRLPRGESVLNGDFAWRGGHLKKPFAVGPGPGRHRGHALDPGAAAAPSAGARATL